MVAEIKAVWRAIEAVGYDFAPPLKLLFLTGQRRDEVFGIRRSELEGLDTNGPVWTIPKLRTKNKKEHKVPLAPLVAAIIKDAIGKIDKDQDIIFSNTGGRTPLSGFSCTKKRLDKAANIKEWRLHDFRRTMATLMADRLKVRPHVIEAILNHISTAESGKGGVAGVYNRAEYMDEKRSALEAWEQFILNLVGMDRDASNAA
jgi:integrase